MPIADAVTPEPGVGEPGRLEHRLDRAVLAERAVEGDEDHRLRRPRDDPVDRFAGRV